MSPKSRQEYDVPVHELAVARHLQWAQDFVIAGDYASAVDELLDAQSLKGELRSSRHGFGDGLGHPQAE